MSLKKYYLEHPTKEDVQSGTEWRNLVCVCCHVCFEHANSAPHNNTHDFLCDSCRSAIESLPNDDEIVQKVEEIWKESSSRGEVCIGLRWEDGW